MDPIKKLGCAPSYFGNLAPIKEALAETPIVPVPDDKLQLK